MKCQLDERDPNNFDTNTSKIAAAAAIEAAANRQIKTPTQAPLVVATLAPTSSPTPLRSSTTLFFTDFPSIEYPTTVTFPPHNFTNTRSSIIADTSQASSGYQKLAPIFPVFALTAFSLWL
jgi:hypothetical protein